MGMLAAIFFTTVVYTITFMLWQSHFSVGVAGVHQQKAEEKCLKIFHVTQVTYSSSIIVYFCRGEPVSNQ